MRCGEMYARSGKSTNTASVVECFLIMVCMKKQSYWKVHKDEERPSKEEEALFGSSGIGGKHANLSAHGWKIRLWLGSRPRMEFSLRFYHSNNRRAKGKNVTLAFLQGFAKLCLWQLKLALLPPAWQGESISRVSQKLGEIKVTQPWFYSGSLSKCSHAC